ncbi:hypothetical protein FA10DRAFT_248415 [Acaromyces ingoldii]|uniref:CNH domain-containing protein n=1 Tax=Acaromyces ingoldii TaxID=215250 RepID=A0A316YWY3_9BASI|nr:hypothetical protein FA10DRAFT_248415 [Acaromyces ingoldii]PWN93947.1 hypothetical protein FA10DRAFT_248415 [Acaromyces ingoldii]
MHTVVSANAVVVGHKDHVDAILVHAGNVILGGSHGSISAYRLPEGGSSDDQESIATDKATAELAWAVRLSKSSRVVEKLQVIREANLLVSLCDNTVALHELSSLPKLNAGANSQTKGAVAFLIDTSVQKGPSKNGSGDAFGSQNRRFLGSSAFGQAYRPSDATLGRKFGALASSNKTLPVGLRGMEELQRDKEERQKWSTINARLALATQGNAEGATVMTLVTTLVVACRRKLVILRWVDGSFWDTKELALPHTPRSLAFPSPTTLFMGYSSAEYAILTVPLASSSSVADLIDSKPLTAILDVPTSSTSGPRVDLFEWRCQSLTIPLLPGGAELGPGGVRGNSATQPAAPTSAGGGMAAMAGAAFGGLGGYIGMGSKAKPLVVQVEQGEVLVCRDGMGAFLNEEGKPTRRDGLDWRATPEEVVYLKPYVFSLFPTGAMDGGSPSNLPHIQIRSAKTLAAVQTMTFPPTWPDGSPVQAGSPPSVRLLTPSRSGGKSPIYVAVEPTDKGALERVGSSIWRLEMKSWSKQIDELVDTGEYQEALALLDSIDEVLMEDKAERRALIVGLYAVSLFVAGKFDEAIEVFIELEANPAKVVALYPSEISGSLAREQDQWFELFGGRQRVNAQRDGASEMNVTASTSVPITKDRSRLTGLFGRRPQSLVAADSLPSSNSSPAKGPAGHLKAAGTYEDDACSIQSSKSRKNVIEQPEATVSKEEQDRYRRSTDALSRFLADRRRVFKSLLETKPDHSHHQMPRNDEWLLQIPSKPLEVLDLDQLVAVAQTVDTALFKTFLFTKPALLGPLCRLENYCEVEQVEGLLMERKRFSELIALYGTKELHEKALDLLREFSNEEDDVEEKLGPTIRYLQNLGPEHIDIILKTSHWVLDVNSQLGMEIFMADAGKVSLLPRFSIVADLEEFNEDLCLQYLRHLIYVAGEGDPHLHEKLALMLLRRALEQQEADQRKLKVDQLLAFLHSSQQYRTERILSRLPADNGDLFEVRALLLGRLGQHEGALGIYVHKLGDHEKAEAYCVRTYEMGQAEDVFLTLLRIYLRPRTEDEANPGDSLMLALALSLIARHGARIDSVAALDLLPPYVSLSQVTRFSSKALHQLESKRNHSAITRHVLEERALQTSEISAVLHSRRVKVTEARLCSRCLKRLGNSVIAVGTSGDVYHYSCR